MPAPAPAPLEGAEIASLEEMDALLQAHGHIRLAGEVYHHVHLSRLEPGRLEFRPDPAARPELAAELGRALSSVTGRRWMVAVCDRPGRPTLAEQAAGAELAKIEAARADPLVREVLAVFPDARIRITNND